MRTSLIERPPLVDLAGLRTGEPGALYSVASAVRDACRTSGFFYIVNHGIPADLQQCVLQETQKLFRLSSREKRFMDIKKSDYMRGYFGKGEDKSDGVNGDVKEGFDLGLDLPPTDPLVQARLPFYGPNIWPEKLPKFRENLACYYDHMVKLGLDLLRAFSVSLGVAEPYFGQHFIKPIAQLRLLRYPPSAPGNVPRVGAGEHTDFGWITILMQDQIDGLEIKNANDKWISVPSIRDSLVVNVGDLMQRWTNDAYPATIHRVINRADTFRHSVAFFMDPDYHTRVECLSNCTSADRPARYAPIIVGDYMSERFRQTTAFLERAPSV
jgi:isopenicillin N synthase-like dioxygenase